MSHLTHEAFLVFTLRIILGILFFFQGYDKIFRMKIKSVVSFFRDESRPLKISKSVLTLSAYFTSYSEFIGGILLILGLLKIWALYLLALDLILVCAAFSFLKPIWNMNIFFPRLVLLAVLFYLHAVTDIISLDYLLWHLSGK